MQTTGDWVVYSIASLLFMGHYEDFECMLAMCVLHNTIKHECDHHDNINRIEVLLKMWHHAIPVSRFDIEHTIEGASVCNAMVTGLMVHAVASAFEFFMQTLVSQTTPFSDSRIRAIWSINVLLVRCLSSQLLVMCC